MMKRILSAILILITVLACVTFTVSAEEGVITDEGRLPFKDVKENHWFYEAVEFCYSNNIIKGMNEYTFGYNGNLTRAQFVTMLAGLEGVDTNEYKVDQFVDVKAGQWYYGAVSWAYTKGIIKGYTEVDFAPNNPITRAQIAMIMSTYMKGKYEVTVDYDLLESFRDKPKTGHWFYESIAYAVSAGLISGIKSENTLYVSANGTTTRAQAAVIFKNFMEKYHFGSCEHEFTAADCTNAEKCEKCGMVNGLPNGHLLTAYDCGTGGVCLNCGADVPPGGKHDFKDATCTEARTCSVCGLTDGSALGHTNTKTVCERCGKEFFARGLDRAAYYIMTKGQKDKDGMFSYYYYGISYEDTDTYTYLIYYPDDSIYIRHYSYNGDALHYAQIRILFRGDTVNEYEYSYLEGDKCYFIGKGYLDKKTFTADTVEGFSSYEGQLDPVFTENINIILPNIVDDADYMLDMLYGGSVRDLGFMVF